MYFECFLYLAASTLLLSTTLKTSLSMKKLLLAGLCLASSFAAQAQYSRDSEGIPDKDLFGNYIIIRITSLCDTRAEAIDQILKFKAYCEDNSYLDFYTRHIGFWQVKSVDKDKDLQWIGGYCNLHRQTEPLYELDKRFIRMYCENADIWQFKDLISESMCPEEEKGKKKR
jgi:hypothetical protein